MKQIIAIAILVVITAVCMINPLCKADVVEPAEQIFERYEYMVSEGERLNNPVRVDRIIFVADRDMIMIREAGATCWTQYWFNSEDFSEASCRLIAYIRDNHIECDIRYRTEEGEIAYAVIVKEK